MKHGSGGFGRIRVGFRPQRVVGSAQDSKSGHIQRADKDAVILGEAKSTPSLEYADQFASEVRTFFDYFPEHRSESLILIFGSWSVPQSIVARLTNLKIYAMQMGDDTMELVHAGDPDPEVL